MATPQEQDGTPEAQPLDAAAAPRPAVVLVSRGAYLVYDGIVTRCGTDGALRATKREIGEWATYKPRYTSDLLDELIAAGVLEKRTDRGQVRTWIPVRETADGRPIVVHERAQDDERGVVVPFRNGRDVVQAAGQVRSLLAHAARGASVEAETSTASTHATHAALTHATHAAAPSGPMRSREISRRPTRSSSSVGRPAVPHTAASVPPPPSPSSPPPNNAASGEGSPMDDTLDPLAAFGGRVLRPGEYESPLHEAIAERLRSLPVDPIPPHVHALAELAPNQAAFFWMQTELYPPVTTSPNYTRDVLASTYRMCPPDWSLPEPAHEPAVGPRPPEADAALDAAADALTRAMWGQR